MKKSSLVSASLIHRISFITHHCRNILSYDPAVADRSTSKKRPAPLKSQKGLALAVHFFSLGSLIPLKVHFSGRGGL